MSPIVGVLIVLGVVILVLLAAIFAYNGLSSRRLACQEDWTALEALLKRRAQQAGVLGQMVAPTLQYQPAVMEPLAAALEATIEAKGITRRAVGEASLEKAIARVLAAVDRLVALKAQQDLQTLRGELTQTHQEIVQAADQYNTTAHLYDIHRQAFPNNLIASMLAFGPQELFEPPAEHA